MRRLAAVATVLVVLVVFLVILGPFYVIREGEQAVVIRFGQIVATQQEAGLHFKMPVVDNVVRYSARLLSWDGAPQRMPTAENQFIWVDTTARWEIVDPERFYSTLTTLERAYSRLDGIIDGAVRTVISGNELAEAVRDTNVINEIERSQMIEADAGQELNQLDELANMLVVVERQAPISIGRQQLSTLMAQQTASTMAELGIEIRDVVIRQIRYSEDLTESVYDRMVSERRQIAQAYRSFGQGRKQELEGQMENDRRTILSAAYEQAEGIRGEADAQAATIYSDAYSRDPEFFAFWRAVESYRRTLPMFNKTLSTDMEYFNFLYSEDG